MLLAHHHLGGSGPVLLILHANSLHGHCYLPMVEQVLGSLYTCIALDLPGHGASPSLPEDADVVEEYVAAVYGTVRHLGLEGCRVFAHSLGGTITALVESRNPGTFLAIYMFEPPLMTEASRHILLAREAQQGIPSAGKVLSAMARKRRSQWPSQQEAFASLGSKPPFNSWHSKALHMYIQYGTQPIQEGKQVTSGECSCYAGVALQGPACKYQPLLEEPVQLCCTPRTEERVFLAMEPPVAVHTSSVQCPLLWAVTGSTTGPHSRLPTAGRASVREFQQGVLHEFSHLSHFGPQEAPAAVARDIVRFFESVAAGELSADMIDCRPDGLDGSSNSSSSNRLHSNTAPIHDMPAQSRL